MALFRINEEASEDQAKGNIGLDNDAKKGLYLADEYDEEEEKEFIGAGDEKETSKVNIPAALAAKTAGGVAHDDTEDNGVNGVSEGYTTKETIQATKSFLRNRLKKFGKINPDAKHNIHKAVADKANSADFAKKLDRANVVADNKAARNRAKFFSKN
uniref:Uncharacterized protein n=1 Tax=Podoviridae sp. ctOAf25 TaxID=2825245 RepID=A0A8S5PQB4_9CAUD|nr:MAG TPA: hypothetical protein [Podoviridae sp. ctOAf25]